MKVIFHRTLMHLARLGGLRKLTLLAGISALLASQSCSSHSEKEKKPKPDYDTTIIDCYVGPPADTSKGDTQ